MAGARRLTVGIDTPQGEADAIVHNTKQELVDFLSEKFPAGEVSCVRSRTDTAKECNMKKDHFKEKSRVIFVNGKMDEKLLEEHFRGVHFSCRKGKKPESPNQDSFVVVRTKAWTLYGVFDGHGPHGHDVSDLALQALVKAFFTQDYLNDTGAVFTNAFNTTQALIKEIMAKAAICSGSTCTMAFHNNETETLTIAHAGDSRAVLLSYPQKGGTPTAVVATEDHKPNLPAEKARIEKNGGRVVFDGYYNYRVFAKAGMYPGLNMSRALGDLTAHEEAGLTAEPEITVVNVAEVRKKNEAQALVLCICSDGVWEFIESKDAHLHLTLPKGFPEENPTVNCDKLVKQSYENWMTDSEQEISDDITGIVITL